MPKSGDFTGFRSDSQALDDPSAQKVFVDDFVDVGGVHVVIPDPIGVNDRHRTLLAAVEAPGRVDPDAARPGDAGRLHAGLRVLAGLVGPVFLAARAPVGADVRAEEQVAAVVAQNRYSSWIAVNVSVLRRPGGTVSLCFTVNDRFE